VSDYYGSELHTSKDLKTNACTSDVRLSESQSKARSLLHDDVLSSFYGCGSPIPPALEGCTVVDLGCGSGVDVFVCSYLVGPTGKVIGIDMTDPQLDKARKHVDYHMQKFGYTESNVEFRKGFIEDLFMIPSDSVDVVISNCVINLSPNKAKVFQEVHRILKTGGEFYFSDVYTDRRVPDFLQGDKVLWGECLSGALYFEDFRREIKKVGFEDLRVVSSGPITVNNPEIQKKVGAINFSSKTVRLFKLPLEDRCENYGEVATYLGTEKDFPHAFFLDDHHTFVTGYPYAVCGNTSDMIGFTRYRKHFKITPKGPHRGLFDCSGGGGPSSSAGGGNSCGTGCC
jgi:SAM-dependent methyltransferase